MTKDFAQRILFHTAMRIKKGLDLSKDKLISTVLDDCFPENLGNRDSWREIISQRIDHLLSPYEKNAPLIKFLSQPCNHCQDTITHCISACPTDAIGQNKQGHKTINHDLCIECGHCVNSCISGLIAERSEFIQVAQMLMESEKDPLYAILAPSFVGQFGSVIQPEQVKGALKLMGFSGVFEVALAADIITTLEAQEFYRRQHTTEPFMITSCCCPAFIKLVEKRQPKLAHVVSESVSPMIALGRLLKGKEPNCKVVFIGPCIAKKAEAKRDDLSDAIDCVLTYKETLGLLEAAELSLLKTMPVLELEDASHDGRSFAHTSGVSQAIIYAIHDIDPTIDVTAKQGNGIKECNKLLAQAEAGEIEASFLEGMACPNGCVGGPGTIIESTKGIDCVNQHADRSPWNRSMENHEALNWLKGYPSTRLLSSKRRDTVPTYK